MKWRKSNEMIIVEARKFEVAVDDSPNAVKAAGLSISLICVSNALPFK